MGMIPRVEDKQHYKMGNISMSKEKVSSDFQ